MHDPLVVAFEIPRPWPEKAGFPAAADGVRWRIRLHHTCHASCADESPHRDGAFPWWKPSSYSKFWRVAGHDLYWPPLITVWHREPGGRDSGEVCRHYSRRQKRDGTWDVKIRHGWQLHVHHYKIQIHGLQKLRRRLLTRCAWCGGRSTKTDCVNVRNAWNGPRARWWQGERGLYHGDCSSIASAHATCTCESPVLEFDSWGRCARCDSFRACGMTTENLGRVRELQAVPVGGRLR